jgi:hypothetical protein
MDIRKSEGEKHLAIAQSDEWPSSGRIHRDGSSQCGTNIRQTRQFGLEVNLQRNYDLKSDVDERMWSYRHNGEQSLGPSSL